MSNWKRPRLVICSAPLGTKLHSARTLSSLMGLLQWNLHHRHGTPTASLTFQDWQGTGTACTDSCRGFGRGLKSGLSVNFHLMLKHWSWQGDQAAPTTRPLCRQRFTGGFPAACGRGRGKPCAQRAAPSCKTFPGKEGNPWASTRASSLPASPASQLLVSI